ncbi:MAG TPA: hypothetical protein VJQ83_08250 [Tepidiformaceae bacterium]|nr:hypothetical protein [Tepidiformaceae bacterium]
MHDRRRGGSIYLLDGQPMFRRKPRITEEIYGRLVTSFGRVVAADPLVAGPATALADRVCGEESALAAAVDAGMYAGAAHHHLQLLAGAWILSNDGVTPARTAEIFEEALVWKFEPLARGSGALARSVSALAKGDGERDLQID